MLKIQLKKLKENLRLVLNISLSDLTKEIFSGSIARLTTKQPKLSRVMFHIPTTE